MPGLDPGIQTVRLIAERLELIAGSSPAMRGEDHALIFAMSASDTSKLA